ncbi:MAG: response regulator [Planctomycetota bacterium]|nr:response regulator [Planctomycetota bacterium]
MDHAPPAPLLNVFLAEDDNVQLTVLRHVIGNIDGLNLSGIARDGKQAVDWLLQAADGNEPLPDVVLCDVNMPIMDGFDVLAAAKSNPRLKSIPFVMLTTSSDDADIERAYVYGAASYMNKAFSVNELAESLRRFTDYWLVAKYRPESVVEFIQDAEVEIAASVEISDSDHMLRILNAFVIEDDPVQVKLIESAIGELSMIRHVGTSRDGDAGLAELHALANSADRPNLVLCDIQLPGRNGVEVLRELRSNSNYRFTPIVMLTASREDEYVVQCYDAGATTLLHKPVEIGELTAVVRMLGRYWTDKGIRVPWS